MRAFLQAPSLNSECYAESTTERRARGIPPGTSISLFLANVAATSLDKKLERLGVGFARYADDTLIWSNEYGEVSRAVDAMLETSRLMGVDLNFAKSDGISILTQDGEPGEFKSKRHVEFVGHAIYRNRVSFKPARIAALKEKLAYLIYSNLLQPLIRRHIVPQRFAPNVDRDYYMAVLQVRRYLYGDLSEGRLRSYLAQGAPLIRYRGYLSYFPLVDDPRLFRELDGWLLHTFHAAVRKRTKILTSLGHLHLPPPHGLSKEQLFDLRATSVSSGADLDVRIPSFARMGKLLRDASERHGPNAIASARAAEYYRAP